MKHTPPAHLDDFTITMPPGDVARAILNWLGMYHQVLPGDECSVGIHPDGTAEVKVKRK